MGWFNKRTDVYRLLAEMEGNLRCAHAFAFAVLQELSPEQKAAILGRAKAFIGNKMGDMKPNHAPQEYQQVMRDEFSRVVQLYVSVLEKRDDDAPPQSN